MSTRIKKFRILAVTLQFLIKLANFQPVCCFQHTYVCQIGVFQDIPVVRGCAICQYVDVKQAHTHTPRAKPQQQKRSSQTRPPPRLDRGGGGWRWVVVVFSIMCMCTYLSCKIVYRVLCLLCRLLVLFFVVLVVHCSGRRRR